MRRERWIKVSVAATRLGKSVWTVYALIHARKLTAYRDEDTGSWRVGAASVEGYLRTRTVQARVITPAIAAVAERLPMSDEPWRGSIFGEKRRTRRKSKAS